MLFIIANTKDNLEDRPVYVQAPREFEQYFQEVIVPWDEGNATIILTAVEPNQKRSHEQVLLVEADSYSLTHPRLNERTYQWVHPIPFSWWLKEKDQKRIDILKNLQ